MILLEIDAVRTEAYASDAEIESTRSKHVTLAGSVALQTRLDCNSYETA